MTFLNRLTLMFRRLITCDFGVKTREAYIVYLEQNTRENLAHCDSSLDPRGHSIHAGAHPQEVNGLVLLTDGILCMDPSCLHVSLLDSLRNKEANLLPTKTAYLVVTNQPALLLLFLPSPLCRIS